MKPEWNRHRPGPRLGLRLCFFGLVCAALLASAAAANDAAAAADDDGRRARLEARIAELEKTLAALSTDARPQLERVPTDDAGAAGRRARRDVTPEEVLRGFAELARGRQGAELYRSIAKQLQRGEEGFQVLYDLLRFLDRDRRLASRFVANYNLTFGHAHHAMLHDVELARFCHYYLAASSSEPQAFMRQKLYEFFPVFLEFYAGRFPDLEEALHDDINERLTRGDGHLPSLVQAMEALRFFPDINLIYPLLLEAPTYQKLGVVLDHLVFRDDRDAVGALIRYMKQKENYARLEGRRAMSALARMTSFEAEEALGRYLQGDDPQAFEAATLAFYSVPRDATDLTTALQFFSSTVSTESKRRFAQSLKSTNHGVWEALGARPEDLPPSVRDLFSGGKTTKPPKDPPE